MKVPNVRLKLASRLLSLSRLQNEGSQLSGRSPPEVIKSIKATDEGSQPWFGCFGVLDMSIKATDEGSQPTYVGMSQAI